MKKFLLPIIILLLILAIWVALPRLSPQPTLIKIALNEWPSYAVIPYGIEKGIFLKHGVNVRATYIENLPELNRRVAEDEFDGMTAVFSDLISFMQNDIPMKGVAIVDQSVSGDVILASPDIKSFSDLKGKRVGFETVNSFSHLFTVKLLEKNGLKQSDVLFENVLARQIPEKIASGEIVAGHTFNPTKARGLKMGQKILAQAGDIPGLITEVIAFHGAFLKTHPADIKKFIAAYFEAQSDMLKDYLAAAKVVQPFFQNDPEQFAATFKEIKFTDLKENRKLFSENDPHNMASIIKEIGDFYVQRGQIPNSETLRQLYTDEFLP